MKKGQVMSFLGDVGSIYMLFLIILLIVGLGLIAKGFLEYLFMNDNKNIGKNKGANTLQMSTWIRISLISLIGIIISFIILSFVSSPKMM